MKPTSPELTHCGDESYTFLQDFTTEPHRGGTEVATDTEATDTDTEAGDTEATGRGARAERMIVSGFVSP